MRAVDATDFGNAGSSNITVGAITQLSSAVFTVQATPTTIGTLQLRINSGAVLRDSAANALITTPTILDDTTITVNVADPYAAWAGVGVAFDADANGDGVQNGVAWILGAANPSASAVSLLPTISTDNGNMIFSFKRAQSSITGTSALAIDVGTTLNSWSTSYTVGGTTAASTAGVTVAKNTPANGIDTITLTLPQSTDAGKFARLRTVQTP